MSGSKAQKGFTLIEVSLAIVIGVIVLAGAITLYNQSKVAAGNSKASEKSLALAGLVEEVSAARNGAYPDIATLTTVWKQRRDDAAASPYGGALANNQPIASPNTFTWGAATNTGDTELNQTLAASAGVAVYITGNGPQTFYDNIAVATRSYNGYMVSVCDSLGNSFSFTNGGK